MEGSSNTNTKTLAESFPRTHTATSDTLSFPPLKRPPEFLQAHSVGDVQRHCHSTPQQQKVIETVLQHPVPSVTHMLPCQPALSSQAPHWNPRNWKWGGGSTEVCSLQTDWHSSPRNWDSKEKVFLPAFYIPAACTVSALVAASPAHTGGTRHNPGKRAPFLQPKCKSRRFSWKWYFNIILLDNFNCPSAKSRLLSLFSFGTWVLNEVSEQEQPADSL